jgi:hypothetical protein
MKGAALGCFGWLVVSSLIASIFGLSDDATGTLGVWIFFGGLVLYFLSRFTSRNSTRVKNTNYSSTMISNRDVHSIPSGCVYLLKAGPFYKIGKSQNFEKRLSQIKLQLPYPVEVIHVFKTRNMGEVETHWHRRFKDKRANGEWFVLTDEDVNDFVRQS